MLRCNEYLKYSLQILRRMGEYLHQNQNGSDFFWNSDEIVNLLSEARNLQGRLPGSRDFHLPEILSCIVLPAIL